MHWALDPMPNLPTSPTLHGPRHLSQLCISHGVSFVPRPGRRRCRVRERASGGNESHKSPSRSHTHLMQHGDELQVEVHCYRPLPPTDPITAQSPNLHPRTLVKMKMRGGMTGSVVGFDHLSPLRGPPDRYTLDWKHQATRQLSCPSSSGRKYYSEPVFGKRIQPGPRA